MILTFVAMILTTPDSKPLIHAVSIDRLKATVAHLSAMPTRNSNSPGLKLACEWLAGEYRKIPNMLVEIVTYPLLKGARVPTATTGYQVVATLPGQTNRLVMMGAHIDSINMTEDPLTGRAPGANDDGSGCAATLEAARILGAHKWSQTLKFVAFSGEEQGLFGSTAMAATAKEQSWPIEALLSNDTIGSSGNKNGQHNSHEVRLFSEEPGKQNSRDLARFIEWVTRHEVTGFGIKLVYRRDRFGRGGDHTPFVLQGFNAVRFVEVHEEYSRQHTTDDTFENMDFDYLAQVTRSNLAALAHLAMADTAPRQVKMVREHGHDTRLTWEGDPGVARTVYWRETTSPVWQGSLVAGTGYEFHVPKINVDDHIFAVGAVGGIPVEAQ